MKKLIIQQVLFIEKTCDSLLSELSIGYQASVKKDSTLKKK